MDNFAFFGLKAQLRARINEAEELTKTLAAFTATSSRLLLFQLGYMNRMADVPWETKVQFMKEIEDTVAKHHIPGDQVHSMKEPLLRFLTLDLFSIAYNVISARARKLRDTIQTEINLTFPSGIDPKDPKYLALTEKLKTVHPDLDDFGELLLSERIKDPKKVLADMLKRSGLLEEDLRKMEPLLDETGDIAADVWSRHTVTERALAFLATFPKYDSWKDRYEAIFGEKA